MAESRSKVLVVDDEPKVAQTLKKLLEFNGHQVTTCFESAKVTSLIKSEEFELVLLDVRMPVLGETELLSLIKKLRPELLVIIVSAYYEHSQASILTALGAYEVVHKPFEVQVFLGAVARAIGK